MRAMFSLLGLLIVAAIVLMLVKQQLGGLKAPAAARPGGAASSVTSSGPGSGPAGTLTQPQAVGQQVQGTLDEAARRTAEAASAAGN
ncbi:hypothetical protein [Roseateles sp.]|uniref:hypothetical protein n=1 Tax=Roseateles sp. TaxID=1971397 RepID=UPI00394D7238